MQEEQGFYHIDGSQLEYQCFSPDREEQATLVFLHEGLGCLAMWRDFPRELAVATGCRTLVYSRAGYGGSSPCQLPRPLTFMHQEGLKVLPQLLDAAKIDAAILVGHSDGASIALINAGGVADPRVQGLVLMAPHVFVEELTLASIRLARSAFLSTDLRQRLAHYHHKNVDATFFGWCDVWLAEGFLNWNLLEFLPKVNIPALLIQGEQDNYGTLKQLEMISAQITGSVECLVLPDCGHAPFRDCPKQSLQAIAAFIKRHPGRARD